ncbi:MAG: CBS domain-containing protein [Rhodospirillaceae bacterium]|nr:CBS domain-containing protein [Rhodospirillaceae bacterium]
MHVKAILESKGREVVTARPDETVAAAAERLSSRRIGAVVVLDERGLPAGILSERDIVAGLARHGEAVTRMTVGELMSRPVRSCRPHDTVDGVMQVMTNRRVRHLPVLDDGRLVGIVSIGDVVKFRLELSEMEVDSLRQYVLESR